MHVDIGFNWIFVIFVLLKMQDGNYVTKPRILVKSRGVAVKSMNCAIPFDFNAAY